MLLIRYRYSTTFGIIYVLNNGAAEPLNIVYTINTIDTVDTINTVNAIDNINKVVAMNAVVVFQN